MLIKCKKKVESSHMVNDLKIEIIAAIIIFFILDLDRRGVSRAALQKKLSLIKRDTFLAVPA